MIIEHKTLMSCAESAFMASAGYRLRGGWDFLDAEGKARWTLVATEVLLAAGCEVRKEIPKL